MNIDKTIPSLLLASLIAAPACGDDSETSDVVADDTTSQGAAASDSTSVGESDDADPQLDDEGSTDTGSATSESDGADETTGADPFAGCDRATLAADFGVVDPKGVPGPPRWYGPGADPKTGELLDDGETTYFVTATYLALQADAFPAFLELNPPLSAALFGNPGMVATQLGASFECNAARTFTVWADEAAMMEFIASEAHVAAVGAFPSLSRGSSTLSVWDELVSPAAITWDEALSRIAAEQAYD